jgi:signal transduction histidine kinase/Tfp pilus assembly protein PilF
MPSDLRRLSCYNSFIVVFLLTCLLSLQGCKDEGDSLFSESPCTEELRQRFAGIDTQIRKNYHAAPTQALRICERLQMLADSVGCAEAAIAIERSMAVIYREFAPLDSARLHIEHALALARSANDAAGIAEAWIVRGSIFFEEGRYDSALADYEQAMLVIDPSRDSLLLAQLYANRGNVHSRRGNYVRSIADYHEAARLFEALRMSSVLAVLYDNIGGDNSTNGHHEQAIEYFNKAIKAHLASGERNKLAVCYANVGVAYKEMGDSERAMRSYMQSLDLGYRLGNSGLIAQNLHNIGNLLVKQTDYANAKKAYHGSMRICEKDGIRYGVLLNTISLGILHLGQKQYYTARKHFDTALPIASEMGLLSEMASVHEGLATIEEVEGRPARALTHLKQHYALQDSLYGDESRTQFQELQVKYETAKKESENQRLRSKNRIQELVIDRQSLAVISFSAIGFVTLVLLIVMFISRRRKVAANALLEEQNRLIAIKSEQLAESNAIKELLLDIITHDLFNPAGTIRNSADLLKQDLPDNDLADIVYRSSARLIGIIENARALSHVAMFERIPREVLIVKDLISTVSEEFSAQLLSSGMQLEARVDDTLSIFANPVITEVIKNYVSNAIKYATEGKRILIEAEASPEHTDIAVSDFGETIPEADRGIIFKRSIQRIHTTRNGHGLGLAIAERIARAHGGQVWTEANRPRGNRFVLRIPHQRIAK